LQIIRNSTEVLRESNTFFINICEYLIENHSVLLNLIEIENCTKFQENERLFIHIYEFYYLNSYESKENKEIFLMIIVEMIEIELKNCEKIDDLYNKNTLTEKILFSFLDKPQIFKYSTTNIRYPFFKILQELEYSDLNKLMDNNHIEAILDEIFSTFQDNLQKIPFLIKFFCYASFVLAEQKVLSFIHLFTHKKNNKLNKKLSSLRSSIRFRKETNS